jgi:hypothetical protein
MAALAGCSRGISYSQKDLNYPKCTDHSTVNVEDIQTQKCDQVGVKFVLPDGKELTAPRISQSTYLIANLGPKGGVIFGETKWKANKSLWWGITKGLNTYWGDFGKFLSPAAT